MKQKQFLLFVCCLLVVAFGYAQKITLSGTVKDGEGTALDMANVVAINSLTNELDSFGITNSNGLYRIDLKINSTYILKISYIGYTTKEIMISTKELDMSYDIVLGPQFEKLDEVEVTYEMPVQINGDTIVYNSDSFTTGSEKKLEDVLKKLPGVEINEDGEVEVEGKRVTKLMVEGQEFFDGDTKMGSKNIPAKALDKIEVLRNYSDVNQLRGVTNNQDNIALNIRLKDGEDHFWFGELTAGKGLDDRFLVHPKVFYYSKKLSVNLITDVNNIGSLPFTPRDYFNFTGGMGMQTSNTGTNFNMSSGSLGISLMQNNRAKSIDTKFGAFNFSYNPRDTFTMGGFVIYSYTGTQLETNTSRIFITTNETEVSTTAIDQKSTLGLAKFNFTYNPNDDLQWDYDMLYKKSEQDEDRSILSVASLVDNIEELMTQKPVSLTQNTNLYYTIDEKNILSVQAKFLHQNQDPFYQVIKEQKPFVGILPLTPTSLYNINQERLITSNRLDANVDYYLITGDQSNLKFNIGILQSRQSFNSNMFQLLEGGGSTNFTDTNLNNDVNYNFSDHYLGLFYKVNLGKLTVNPGVLVHQYTMVDDQLSTIMETKQYNLVPDLFINYDLKKSESLRFNYRISRSFTDIENISKGYVFSNYNRMFSGNRNLESALYHTASLNFFSLNMFNFQNIFANLRYNKQLNAFKNQTAITGINQVNSVYNSNLADETINGSVNYQRTFGKIKLSSSLNLASNTFNNIINDQARVSKSFTQSYRTSFRTQFYAAPNVEIGYSYSNNRYDNGGIANKFYTDTPFVKLDAQFLKNFILTVDYDYYNYRNDSGTISNQFEFLEANLSYQKEDSKWEYSIRGTNLFNTRSLNQDSFNDLFSSTSAYVVQPRYIVFQIKYEL